MLCAQSLRRGVSQLCRKLRPTLLHDGISMAKLSVIGQINRAGFITPTALAHREGVKIQTLTRLLAELESAGWVFRVPDESDGRQSLLSLTAQGRKRLWQAAHEKDTALAAVIDKTFSAKEQLLLLRACLMLDRIDEALSLNVATDPSTTVQG